MGFIFNQNAGETPETLAQKRKIAEALLQQGMDTSPIQSWTQGAARIAQALSGNWARARADREESKGRDAATSGFNSIMSSLFPDNAAASGAVPSAPPSGDMSKGAKIASMLQTDFGLSPAAAAGFAGNLAHESGNFSTLQEIKPTVPGSRGGYGWGQWTGPRRRAFENYVAQNKLDPTSDEANYGFLKYELQNTPEGAVLAKLKGINDPAQAAQIVAQYYERPGVPHMDSRIAYATQIAGMGGAGGGGPAPVETAPGNANGGATVQPAGYSPAAAQQAAQMPMGKIFELMSNPYLSEAQQGILSQVIKQKMAQGQMSEKDLLDLEQARLTNEKLKAEIAKANSPDARAKLGLNPQYGVDKAGNPVLLQIGENGQAVQTQMPDGVTLSKEPIRMDAGTHFVLLDPITRQQIGVIPKDLQGAEASKALGQQQGEAQAELPGAKMATDYVSTQIDDVLNDPDLQSITGYKSYLPEALQSNAMIRVRSKLDQIGGQAFMQARTMLKGGGAITDFESKKAEGAYSRIEKALRSSDVNELKSALQDFKDAVNLGYQKLQARAGQQPGATPAPPAMPIGLQPGAVDDGYRFKGGDPADPNNWEPVQ